MSGMAPVIEAAPFLNINTATTTQVKTGDGRMVGFLVASCTGATIKIYDNTAASGTVVMGTLVPIAGGFYPVPAKFVVGLCVVTTGTIDMTVFYE